MTIRTIELTEATQSLATYAQDIATGPLVLTINGNPLQPSSPCPILIWRR